MSDTIDPVLTEEIAGPLLAAIREAEQHFQDGRPDEARDRLEGILLRVPEASALRARVLSDLAVISAHAGQHQDAIALAGDAVRANADFEPANELLDHYFAQRVSAVNQAAAILAQRRAQQYGELSTCLRVTGMPTVLQPMLTLGRGSIAFGERVVLGYRESPGFYEGCIYLEAERATSAIEIGSDSLLNNCCSIRSQGAGVNLGDRSLIGWSVQIFDSDFHELHPDRRHGGTPKTAPVILEPNVFVGSNTIICKGVTIGRDSVVGAGSVVVKSLPAGVIAAGNPAVVIRELGD